MAHLAHLVRRFLGAVSHRPPSAADVSWATSLMTRREAELWTRMSAPDQRHSIDVARRFETYLGGVGSRPAMAAALLHDVGKLDSRLGTSARVVATVIGPRTHRLRSYHDHERIGAEMLRAAGSDPETSALVDGTSTDVATIAALRWADDI